MKKGFALKKELFINLFRKYTSGECSADEKRLFFTLLREYESDPRFLQLIDELYQAGDAIRPSASYVTSEGQVVLVPELPHTIDVHTEPFAGHRQRHKLYYFWLAASLTALLVIGGIWWNAARHFSRSGMRYQTGVIQSQVGEAQTYTLEDGSQVTLIGLGQMRYPAHFHSDKREIYLEGEALFDIKDPNRTPFVIYTPNNITITATSNRFLLKALPTDKDVMLQSGEQMFRIK